MTNYLLESSTIFLHNSFEIDSVFCLFINMHSSYVQYGMESLTNVVKVLTILEI